MISNLPFLARAWVAVSLSALGVGAAGCTLQNSVEENPEDELPPNIFRDAPSERSLELWEAPGDNLLAALAEVEENDATSVLPIANGPLGALSSELGLYYTALTTFQPLGDSFLPERELCEDSALPDAVEELCERIIDNPDDPEDQDGEQLVFINMVPHAALHRAIALRILSCAKEAGYTYLALEALEEDAEELTSRGYVSRTRSGRLMREPQLARVAEEALALDYTLVDFDTGPPCDNCTFVERVRERASEQAENLIAKTLDRDPEARVLVLGGPFQSYKQPWGQNPPFTTSLAAHVWEKSGVEPYAIDQVAINLPALPFGESSPNPPSGMYMASGPNNGVCMGQYAPSTPTGIGALNTVIVHVPPQGDERRWDWLHAPPDERRTLTPSCGSCEPGQRLLVQAFPAGVDSADRVPVDQTVCASGSTCQVVLPAASYHVVVWSEDARVGEVDVDLESQTAASVAL